MTRQSFVYLLHFDIPLAHAEHYAGCTHQLRQRLARHAAGAGSTLTRVLHERKIPWRLAALGTCCHAEMRRLERTLKDQANGPRFCPICTDYPTAIPGCLPYPITEIKFPIDSASIILPTRHPVIIRSLKGDNETDALLSVRAIANAERDCLGWIPCGGDEGLNRLAKTGGLTVVQTIPGDVVAYAAWSLTHDRTRLTIHQLAVREEQRLQQYGRSLATAILSQYPCAVAVAKVREDLAANNFWTAIGWERKRQAIHKTSRATINHYYHLPLIKG